MSETKDVAPTEGPSATTNESPAFEKASAFSRLIYTWVNPILRLTKDRVLGQRDLGRVPQEYRCEPLSDRFSSLWSQYDGNWRKIILNFDRKTLGIIFILLAFSDVFFWSVQILLKKLIEGLETRSIWNSDGSFPVQLYLLATGFLGLTIMRILLENGGMNALMGLVTQFRTAIMGSLYVKAQRFSHGAREKYAGGMALNVVSVDPNRLYNFIFLANRAWMVPVHLIVSFTIGASALGWAILPGIILVLLIIPILLIITSKIKKLRFELATVSDTRMQATQESLQSIKVIKYLGLEEYASTKIGVQRDRELSLLRRSNYLHALSLALTFWVPIFSATLSIATIALLDGRLVASKVFAVILAFQTLISPLRDMPNHLGTWVQAKNSMARISAFMKAPEINDTFSHDLPPETAILVRDAEMVWDSPPPDLTFSSMKKGKPRKRRKTLELPVDSTVTTLDNFALKDINLRVNKGALVAVIGSIGSGKTSLLESLMGSLKIEQGSVAIAPGSIGYCEQSAWICNASVRDNIVFGRPFDEERYRKVIEQCCLERDLEILPFGDETIIGEKGATISGGQKQRIGLARVFYSRPDLVLLDDPFSAVDANVGRELFYSIKDGLLNGTTRIIATHNRSILDEVDLILIMEKGRIKAQGSYENLVATTDPRLAAIREILLQSPLYESDGEEEEEESELEESESSDSSSSSEEEEETPAGVIATSKIKGRPKPTRKNPKKLEERISKKASSQSYSEYVKGFGGYEAVVIIAILVLTTEIVRVSKDLYMKSQIKSSVDGETFFIIFYSGMGLLQGVLSASANLMSVSCCTAASRYIHSVSLKCVLYARLAVFDVTPIGRILNRFARDLEVIDNNFPDKFTFLLTCFSTILAALIIIIWAAPYIAISFAIPVVVAYLLQKPFGRVWRQLQQLQGQSLGPVVAHFTETLAGLPTIRALGANALFTKTFFAYMDDFGSSSVWLVGIRRWLGLRSELIANTYVYFLMLMMIYLETPFQVVGLLISYMVNAADCIDWAMKYFSEVETCFVSVERLYKYVVDLDSELKEAPILKLTSSEWPSNGKVIFDNVTIRYRPDLPPALIDLSFELEAGEKVAIVGRTGAGKSSIITCLFRFVELAEGRILIDGIDIRQISPHYLRKCLAMVPQDPVLFSGTIRHNLDPNDCRTDVELWNALEACYMKDVVMAHPEKLEMDVGERGGSFSIGQRQLLCLARAMLRKSRLVIMDEATSSIDRDTDALIQKSIRKCFEHATVITIAHRLETIMEYDRVIVMADGRIIEAGIPKELARTEGTAFNDMATTAGIDIDEL